MIYVHMAHPEQCALCPEADRMACRSAIWAFYFGLVPWETVFPSEYQHHNEWMALVS